MKNVFPDNFRSSIIRLALSKHDLASIVSASFLLSPLQVKKVEQCLSYHLREQFKDHLKSHTAPERQASLTALTAITNTCIKYKNHRAQGLSPEEIDALLQGERKNFEPEKIQTWHSDENIELAEPDEEGLNEMISALPDVNYDASHYSDILATLSALARKDGLLSIEDFIQAFSSDLLRRGLQLIVDGTDPVIVEKVLDSARERLVFEYDTTLKTIVDGVLGIQQGDNPRILHEKMSARLAKTELDL